MLVYKDELMKGAIYLDFQQLQKIYPTAKLSDTRQPDSTILNFPYDNQWIQLENIDLSTSEIKLLNQLFKQPETDTNLLNTHFWYQFLWENEKISTNKNGDYRVIQFELIHPSQNENATSWLEAFQSIFEGCEDAFFINKSYGMIIEEKGNEGLTNKEILGVIQTLEDDFSIKSICYIGQYWNLSTSFSSLFNEEYTIFQKQKEQNKGLSVLSLSQLALPHYIKSAIEDSGLLSELKKIFSDQTEWRELVKALWETQGNISMAAKSLYVHRNTLQYRLDRFNEATGFSLKDKNDLMLCYLLLL